ncbi:hypothetical protein COCOBI_06-2930 [Coccomyxa sp. Obi]|nr:hypothetical protein COCOBI_06-2930 [Coccomyxa sp. Obi]
MVRTRSSRKLEGSAEVEQLPVSTKVSTRRRRKQTATETVVDAEERTPESAAQQAACSSDVHPKLSQEPGSAGTALATDHDTASVPLDGNSERAAALPDVAQHSPARDGGEIDFSGEAAQLAEAIMNLPEDEHQTPEPAAPTDEQHQSSSEFAPAHPEMESLPVLDDANRRDQTIGAHADMELQEEPGIGSTSAQEISASAPPGGAPDDSLPTLQGKASSDHRQADGNIEVARSLGISEGLEPIEVQAAANACPHTGQDAPEDSIDDDLASGRPEAAARDATTSTLLQKRSSMRSGSLEAYERGRKSGIWHGAANANMGALEQDWDSYKASSVRGWTMPSLKDVQAKSEALALSGFTVVSSPKIRASSRSKLQVENKRKAGGNVPDGAAAPRKAPKVGETPSKRQVPPAKGRCWAASPSRFKQNTSSLPAPKGKGGIKSEGRTGGPPVKPLGERIPRPQRAV